MKIKIILILTILLHFYSTIQAVDEESFQNKSKNNLANEFHWIFGSPILKAIHVDGENWVSVKDPSIVQFNDSWHLFVTVRGHQRSHAIVYLSFPEWNRAHKAERHVLTCHDGYFCAPQVLYFSPHKRWYLICQASTPNWNPEYQAAYSTTKDISDPNSWAPLKPLVAEKADGKSGLDFWVICDDLNAYLFFTTLDGRMWQEKTSLENFPHGWSEPNLAIQGDIFEASHIYRIKASGTFLTLVEAQNGHGWRYFKAYVADSLAGMWHPLAAEKDNAFASMKNVEPTSKHWTDSISHGELIRSGYDEKLVVDADNLTFLFQGVTDAERSDKNYGMIPWKLGILKIK